MLFKPKYRKIATMEVANSGNDVPIATIVIDIARVLTPKLFAIPIITETSFEVSS